MWQAWAENPGLLQSPATALSARPYCLLICRPVPSLLCVFKRLGRPPAAACLKLCCPSLRLASTWWSVYHCRPGCLTDRSSPEPVSCTRETRWAAREPNTAGPAAGDARQQLEAALGRTIWLRGQAGWTFPRGIQGLACCLTRASCVFANSSCTLATNGRAGPMDLGPPVGHSA